MDLRAKEKWANAEINNWVEHFSTGEVYLEVDICAKGGGEMYKKSVPTILKVKSNGIWNAIWTGVSWSSKWYVDMRIVCFDRCLLNLVLMQPYLVT